MTSANKETGGGGVDEPVASDLRAIEWELSEIARRIEGLRQQLQTLREGPEQEDDAGDRPRGAL
jgi:hypothetical protein